MIVTRFYTEKKKVQEEQSFSFFALFSVSGPRNLIWKSLIDEQVAGMLIRQILCYHFCLLQGVPKN